VIIVQIQLEVENKGGWVCVGAKPHVSTLRQDMQMNPHVVLIEGLIGHKLL